MTFMAVGGLFLHRMGRAGLKVRTWRALVEQALVDSIGEAKRDFIHVEPAGSSSYNIGNQT